ncbi:ATP-binding protein [Lachnospiraceae bacterium 62-35]
MKYILDYADLLIDVSGYLGYIWAADKFCKKYLEASKKNELLFMIFSISGWLLMNIGNRRYLIPHIFFMMLSHIFFMGLVLLLFRAEREKKILAASILMIAMTLVKNCCESLLACLTLVFLHTVKKIPEPFFNELESGLITCVSFAMVILAVYWMSKHLMPVFSDKPRKWYIILAIPLLVITTVFDVASWGACNGIMVRSGGNMGLYYDQIFSHTEFCVLAVLSMSAAGFYLFGMERIYLEQEKSSHYHLQIAVYKMLEEQYKQSERLRHDMKNHIAALSGLFHNKEWEKMGSYLKNMEGSSLEDGDITGNKAVDALLYQKRKRAQKENIKWECDVQISKVCCINEFDLCVLFGNILDNAMEACERLQCNELHGSGDCFINIQAKTVKKCFLLEVKNSMDMMERYVDGFTNKENPQEHGIGLLNVSDVVHRYSGAMNIEAENGIFVISILMPLNAAAYDMKQAV